MTNEHRSSTEILEEAHELGARIAAVDFVERYRMLESKVDRHEKIQHLLEELKRASGEEYSAIRKELFEIPLFTEYIEQQQQVEDYLKDIIHIFVKAVSPKITLQEKTHSGGCHHCHGC